MYAGMNQCVYASMSICVYKEFFGTSLLKKPNDEVTAKTVGLFARIF